MSHTEKRYPTVDELVSTLRHSSLPTVVIEGRDDIIVFRRIEERLGGSQVSVLAAGCRSAVLRVFDRRNEFAHNCHVIFVIDRDTWIYEGIPAQFNSAVVLITSGYSIENDCYVDGDFEKYMTQSEKQTFITEADRFIRWYAKAITAHLKNPINGFKNHPNEILVLAPSNVDIMTEEEIKNFSKIKDNYRLFLRGKSLFSLLLRQLSHSKRTPKYSSHLLLEKVACDPGALVGKLFAEIEAAIATPTGSAPSPPR